MTTTREAITETLSIEATATVSELVELTGRSETSVRKALKDMLADGAVEIDASKGEPAHYRTVSVEDQAYAAANAEIADQEAEYAERQRAERARLDAADEASHAAEMDDMASSEQPAAPAKRGARKIEVSELDLTAAKVLKAKRQDAGIKRAALAREAGTTDAKLWRIEERAHIHDGELEEIEAALERMIVTAA